MSERWRHQQRAGTFSDFMTNEEAIESLCVRLQMTMFPDGTAMLVDTTPLVNAFTAIQTNIAAQLAAFEQGKTRSFLTLKPPGDQV